jgi:hypothetical protein
MLARPRAFPNALSLHACLHTHYEHGTDIILRDVQVGCAVDNLIKKSSALDTILVPIGLGAAIALVSYMMMA